MSKKILDEKALNDKHKPLTGRCYYCICRVCNMLKCRYKNQRELCLSCMIMDNTAKLDCEGFESRYYRRIFRIKRDLLRPQQLTTRQMVQELHHMVEDLWKRGRRW